MRTWTDILAARVRSGDPNLSIDDVAAWPEAARYCAAPGRSVYDDPDDQLAADIELSSARADLAERLWTDLGVAGTDTEAAMALLRNHCRPPSRILPRAPGWPLGSTS